MKKLFAKYLQSVCTPEEFREIVLWISKKENESSLSSMLKPQWEHFMQDDSTMPLNHNLWQKIKQAIEDQEKEAMQRRLKIYTWGLRVAAVLVAALLITNFFFLRQSAQPEALVQTQTITIPNGARSNLSLADGSEVWLNSGSVLTYSSDFSGNRMLELEGEAYFEVVKSEIPFTVTTAFGNVQVTGTSFNVKALPVDKQFETTVEDGSVNVYSSLATKTASLKPGQQARLINGQWELSKVETELYTSWKEGKIIFRREYLPEVAKRLERWYNVKIELADDVRLNKIHYTGTLEMESFSEVLELLKVTASINFTYNDKTRVIRITHR
jgi:transmembrane sensor